MQTHAYFASALTNSDNCLNKRRKWFTPRQTDD